jgi:polygalacturonase
MPITKADQNVFEPVLATGSTTSRLLQDRFADVINVKDFGAAGDGVADDRQAWVNIINQFPTQQVTVYIPRGEYTCSGSTLIAPNNILFKFDKCSSIKRK